MSYPFLGEIRMYGGATVPENWASCDGQLLPIAGNEALFGLLATNFGGDGTTTFGVPDLRGHVPLHFGAGPGLSPWGFGDTGGDEKASISPDQLPPHAHPVNATSVAGSGPAPSFENIPGVPEAPAPLVPLLYAVPGANPVVPAAMRQDSVGPGAGCEGEPHENRMPLLAIRFMIAVTGIMPVRPQTQET